MLFFFKMAEIAKIGINIIAKTIISHPRALANAGYETSSGYVFPLNVAKDPNKITWKKQTVEFRIGKSVSNFI